MRERLYGTKLDAFIVLVSAVALPLLGALNCASGQAEIEPAEPAWKSDILDNTEAFCALFKPKAYGALGSEMDQWYIGSTTGGDERIAQLQEAIQKYPESPYADDAALLLARAYFLYGNDTANGIAATVNGRTIPNAFFPYGDDAKKAIAALYDVIKRYPGGEWIAEDRVVIEDIAGRVLHNSGRKDKAVFPAAATGHLRDVTSYMEYASEHPNWTSDEAKYWIAWILFKTRNEQRYQEAEDLLRSVIARHKDADWTQADLEAAKQFQNRLIATALVRSERMAYNLLIPLLKKMGKDAAAVQAAAEAKRIGVDAARAAAARAIEAERAAFLRTIKKPPVSTPDLPPSASGRRKSK